MTGRDRRAGAGPDRDPDPGSGGDRGHLARGTLVVSIDTELAWGAAHHRDGAGPVHRLDTERQVVARLLDLLARYEIPATWAVVGHLFLDACGPGADGRLHPELERPDYDWLEGDWLDVDPASDIEAHPHHYGRDLVERILACPVPQEIGSHSFTHVIADDPGCRAAVLASELRACREVAAGAGVDTRSFVYPRNAIAHLDALVPAGFTSYRGGRPRPPFADRRGWQRRALALVDRVRPLAGSAVWPTVRPDGLVNVPQTYLYAPDVRGRRLPLGVWSRFPAARLRQAARERSLCHLWFHPYNITAVPERALAGLERICRVADRERRRGRLDVLTMSQVAARVTGSDGERAVDW